MRAADINKRGFYGGGREVWNATLWASATTQTYAPAYNSMASITDGTSNTVAYSEAVVGTVARNNDKVKGSFAYVSNTFMRPNQCAARISTTDRTKYLAGAVSHTYVRGWCFADGCNIGTMFNTIMPPNSATCEYSNTSRTSARGYYTATSNHPGGVNACYADGSVHFISDTIDCGDQNYLGNTADTEPNTEPKGESPFGVWGALGSIAGGESKTF